MIILKRLRFNFVFKDMCNVLCILIVNDVDIRNCILFHLCQQCTNKKTKQKWRDTPTAACIQLLFDITFNNF